MHRNNRTLGTLLGASLGLLFVSASTGCGGDDGEDPNKTPPPPACTPALVTGQSNKAATNTLKLPGLGGNKPYTYDFDGDMRQENQLKNLMNTVSLSGVNLQESVDKAVSGGDAIVLMDVKTPDLTKSDCVSVTLGLAKPPGATDPKPTFDGTDTFQMATDVAPIMLFGKIDGGKLTTVASKDQKADAEQKIEIRLPLGDGNTLPLALRGAHFEGSVVKVGTVLHVKDGILHGVLSQKDIDEKIVPLVATLLSGMINKDPTSDTAKTVIGLFENQSDPVTVKKCADTPKDCCKTSPTTCKILPAEVKTSAVGGVLAPDVQVFDSNGKWAPTPGGKKYDGMSVGIGFTGIQAKY